jgi:hypothetical protein
MLQNCAAALRCSVKTPLGALVFMTAKTGCGMGKIGQIRG